LHANSQRKIFIEYSNPALNAGLQDSKEQKGRKSPKAEDNSGLMEQPL